MPRANRYILPSQLYHVTHRCHNRSFLLKFAKDRDDYRRPAIDMSGTHGVWILNYCLTSNHVHILLEAKGKEAVSRFMQDLAGTFALHYNRRKGRSGGYWEGRYHATMIDNGAYLWACLQYIDLNMVRAGVVRHPDEWPWTGWHEIMRLRKRYCLIDLKKLIAWTGHADLEQFRKHYTQDITNRIQHRILQRESQWTEAVAVGTEAFIQSVTQQLPDRRRWQFEETTIGRSTGSVLREATPAYMHFSPSKNAAKTI